MNLPLIGVVNQLDHDKTNWDAAVESIASSSKHKPVLVQYPANAGSGFHTFIELLLLKMFAFKDENGTRPDQHITE